MKVVPPHMEPPPPPPSRVEPPPSPPRVSPPPSPPRDEPPLRLKRSFIRQSTRGARDDGGLDEKSINDTYTVFDALSRGIGEER